MTWRTSGFPWRLGSLRARALLIAIAVAIVPVGLVALSAPWDAQLERRMLNQVASAVAEGAQPADDDEMRRHQLDATSRRFGMRMRWFGADGLLRHEVDNDTRSWTAVVSDVLLAPPDATSALAAEQQQGELSRRPEVREQRSRCDVVARGDLLYCAAATRLADGATLYASRTSRRGIGTLADVRYLLVKLSAVFVLFAVAVGWYLGRRIVRPMEELTARVKQATASASTPTPLLRNDEVGNLSAAFSQLSARLVERTRQNEAFVLDLAHELKNPIAAVRAVADSIDDDTERGQRLARVLSDSSKRMDALVSLLLELARVEAGRMTVAALCDLSALTLSCLDDGGNDSSVSTERNIASGLVVHGSEPHLESVVRNLIDNARSFAASSIHVNLMQHGDAVVLQVQDDGPGIDAADVPRVFERFFSNRSRARHSARHAVGLGLGLALAKAVVVAHGGTIEVQSPSVAGGRGGATFTVTLRSA